MPTKTVFRYKLTIEYDGTPFIGWQKQHKGISVQSVIEDALQKFTGGETPLTGAGRTDAGVHAKGAVAHFDAAKEYAPFNIVNGLNFYLHDYPVSILSAEAVGNDFHARFSAKSRSYLYRILARRSPPALDYKRVWHIPVALDVKAMEEGAKYLLGKHDFSAFRSAECQAKNPIRTLDELTVTKAEGDEIHIHARARSFLHNQVRIMTGTLYNVGLGKITPEEIEKIIAAKDRTLAGPTAPAFGLYLMKVEY